MTENEPQDFLERINSRAASQDISFLRAVTDVVPGIMYVFNVKTMTNEYANRSVGDWLGLTIQEVADLGSDFLPTHAHPDELPAHMAHFERLQRLEDGEVAVQQYRMRHVDGTWHWFQSFDTAFERAEDGSVERIIGTAIEITEQKDAEADVFLQRQAGLRASKNLQATVEKSSVAISGPAARLLANLEKLQSEHLDQFDVDGSRAIREGVQTASRMNDFLFDARQYSQILMSKTPFETVSLETVFAEAVSVLADELEMAQAIVDIGTLPDVKGDALQLQTLFQRLILHAIRHRQPDVSLLIVVSDTSPAWSRQAEISVTDNGKSVPLRSFSSQQEMFREVFVENVKPGMTLAPAICQRIAVNHNSKIQVRTFPSRKVAYSIFLDRV